MAAVWVSLCVVALGFLSFANIFLLGEPFPGGMFGDGEFARVVQHSAAMMMVVGPALWLLVAILALVVFRRRALPILVGLPFAAAPVIFLGVLLNSCAKTGVCL